jgi:hypothetical protein
MAHNMNIVKGLMNVTYRPGRMAMPQLHPSILNSVVRMRASASNPSSTASEIGDCDVAVVELPVASILSSASNPYVRHCAKLRTSNKYRSQTGRFLLVGRELLEEASGAHGCMASS